MAAQRLLLRVGLVQVYDARPQMATYGVTECDGGVTRQERALTLVRAWDGSMLHESPHQHHLPRLDILTSSQAVEVDPTGKP